NGIPQAPAGTISVIGDLKQMKPQWLVGTSMLGYGVTLIVGIGVPIPVLDEETIQYAAAKDKDIYAQIVDYSTNYPNCVPGSLGEANYEQLKSGKIIVQGKEVPTGNLSSYSKAREVSEELKAWINKGDFLLSEAVAPLPKADSGYGFKMLKERPILKNEE
ncbi:MAG: homocysteine biosynthesis protein, partial [Candidatus Omnitrophota bacterium]